MIINPPSVTCLLRCYAAACQQGIHSGPLTAMLAALLLQYAGHVPWERFLAFYFLYLQAIPAEVAKAAWGLNAAAASALTAKP